MQQDFNEALICIFGSFIELNPNSLGFFTNRYRYTYRCKRCEDISTNDILLGSNIGIPIETGSQLKFDINAQVRRTS